MNDGWPAPRVSYYQIANALERHTKRCSNDSSSVTVGHGPKTNKDENEHIKRIDALSALYWRHVYESKAVAILP